MEQGQSRRAEVIVQAEGRVGYLPIDKIGADCLFQIISYRHERGAPLITTKRVHKQ